MSAVLWGAGRIHDNSLPLSNNLCPWERRVDSPRALLHWEEPVALLRAISWVSQGLEVLDPQCRLMPCGWCLTEREGPGLEPHLWPWLVCVTGIYRYVAPRESPGWVSQWTIVSQGISLTDCRVSERGATGSMSWERLAQLLHDCRWIPSSLWEHRVGVGVSQHHRESGSRRALPWVEDTVNSWASLLHPTKGWGQHQWGGECYLRPPLGPL